jgi:hypothetical protein
VLDQQQDEQIADMPAQQQKARIKLLARRASARHLLGDAQSALGDIKAALVLDPENQSLKQDLATLEHMSLPKTLLH